MCQPKGKCKWCDLGWPLGRFGCHWEPIPDDLLDEDEYYPRPQANCQNWPERRLEFYGGSYANPSA